jgi:hypothetical protein
MDASQAWALAARNKHQRWNSAADRFQQSPMAVHHTPKFQLKAEDKFFCIGSCFARNIEEHLIYSRIEVLSKRVYSPIEEWANRPNAFMNKYTLASMLNELRWTMAPPEEVPEEWFFETDAGWLDPQLSPAANPTSFERVVERRRYLNTEVFSRIREADVVVITLGLVEAWFDNLTGLWLNGSPPPRKINAEKGRFSVTATTVAQNMDWLEQAYKAIKSLNPRARIVVTVSPVPMDTTFSGKDSAVAHVLSKSRLRVVADQFVDRHDDADYFPSFEMISLAPRATTFADDNIHVEDAAVGGVVRAFVKAYIPDAPEAVTGYHEMTYLRSNPEIYASVRRGELSSGFEHWIKTQAG